jgi:hypothetical protein
VLVGSRAGSQGWRTGARCAWIRRPIWP